MLPPDQADEAPEPVIESASATTSPDNMNSGNSAYVITAVGLGLVLLLCMGVAGCVSNLVTDGVGILEQLWYYDYDGLDSEMLLDEEDMEDFDLYSSPDTKDELEELLERMQERGEEGAGSPSRSF
ncbi:hypothetical protein [Olsenella urininfantis]|uniref:hypothetical protein n=1 Tax=Olsenella urininfantis TaxID=1871033 RepID=UPI000987AD88|nr:hypothetical protein [Olsenella urininfantis]